MASPLLTSPAPTPSTPPAPPLRLEFIAASRQSRIFGTERWILKVPRPSVLGWLSRVVVHPRLQARPPQVLGGLIEPYRLLHRGSFPCPLTGRRRSFRWALVRARHAPEAFLDRRIAHATPAEAARLVGRMLDVLATVRARGFHLVDFIMANFVEVDGRLRIADPGLLVPARLLREPTLAVTSRLFAHSLARDYADVLRGVLARQPDGPGADALQNLIATLPARLHAWRAGRLAAAPNAAPPQPAHFDPTWAGEIGALVTLGR